MCLLDRIRELGTTTVQEPVPCAINQRAWRSRIMATASAALSTQHGICMSCGIGFFVPIDTCDAIVIDGEGTALAQMLKLGN